MGGTSALIRLRAGFAADRYRVGFAVLTALFLAVYWIASRGAAVHAGGDTTAYESVARDQFGWSNIFSTQRPPLYLLLIRLLDFSRPLLAATQCAAYVLAWVFLADSMARGRLFVAACVFYVALYPGFAAWNHVLMTESLATSLSVVAFALLVRFMDGQGWALWAFVAVTCLKCFLRGFDSFLALLYLPLLVAATLLHRMSWRSLAVASAAFLFCFVFCNRTSGNQLGSVWFFALMNNVGTRVLPSPQWLAYFVAHGMPVNDALLAMTGHLAHEQHMRFFFDPALADFRAWAMAHGRATYTTYLLHHPRLMLWLLWQHRGEVFLAEGFPLAPYFDDRYRLGVPPWPPFWAVYAAGTLGTLALAVLLWRRRVPRALALPAWTALLLWLTLPPMALLIYHADAGEIVRHSVPVLLQAALGLLLMIRVAARWYEEKPAAR
jgi:hypothetical protein